MSKYTTGELAKLCNVSVRTVQYYDAREILNPSEISEGGRRIYSENDLKKLKMICYLRDLGLSIESIKQLLEAKNKQKVISLLLKEQEKRVRAEIDERQEQLKGIESLKQTLQTDSFSLENIVGVTHDMQNKKKLKKMRGIMLLTGLPVTMLQWSGIILWISTGKWWLFAVWFAFALIYGVWGSKYYFNRVSYVCPECEKVFEPTFKQMFFANHTPKTRKLTCTHCHYKGFCVEIYKDKENGN